MGVRSMVKGVMLTVREFGLADALTIADCLTASCVVGKMGMNKSPCFNLFLLWQDGIHVVDVDVISC